MNSGDHLWWIANADTPERIKNHPLLEGIDVPRTGIPTRSGVLLTKTLLFVGEGTGGAGASLFFAQSTKPRVRYSLNWTCRTIRRVCHSPMSMMASNTWRCSLAAAVIPHSWSLTHCPDSRSAAVIRTLSRWPDSANRNRLMRSKIAQHVMAALCPAPFRVPDGRLKIPSSSRMVAACPRQ